MPSGAKADTVRLARIGLLMALAGALQALEGLVPTPAPWFRLGLGNAIVLASLHHWGAREAAWVALGKVIVGSLLSGRLLSPGFFLALGGTACSTTVMMVALRAAPPLGFVGVSVLGAEAHALAQLSLARALFVRTPALWSLAPLLGIVALASGCLTGIVAFKVAQTLDERPNVVS
jgi:heptaprenyl diphosphate synthase